MRGAATLEAAPDKTDVLQLIPAGKGKATHLKKGDKLKIINSQGMQVGCRDDGNRLGLKETGFAKGNCSGIS